MPDISISKSFWLEEQRIKWRQAVLARGGQDYLVMGCKMWDAHEDFIAPPMTHVPEKFRPHLMVRDGVMGWK